MPAALLPAPQALQGLARQWEDALLAERGLSPATEASYAQDIDCLLAFLNELGGGRPCVFDDASADCFLAWRRAQGDAPRTLARRLSALRAFFRHLLDEGEIDATFYYKDGTEEEFELEYMTFDNHVMVWVVG